MIRQHAIARKNLLITILSSPARSTLLTIRVTSPPPGAPRKFAGFPARLIDPVVSACLRGWPGYLFSGREAQEVTINRQRPISTPTDRCRRYHLAKPKLHSRRFATNPFLTGLLSMYSSFSLVLWVNTLKSKNLACQIGSRKAYCRGIARKMLLERFSRGVQDPVSARAWTVSNQYPVHMGVQNVIGSPMFSSSGSML